MMYLSRQSSSRFSADPFVLFAVEGALLQTITSINSFGNNLFATALGATDSQIGMVQTVPNVAAVLLLLPLGLLADRLRSTRTIPLVSLLCIAAGFFMLACVPLLDSLRLPAFYLAIAFSVGGPVIYNAQWQNFFGDVVAFDCQNQVLTRRNGFMFTVGILTPLLCGIRIGRHTGAADTLSIFQWVFLLCSAAMLMQALVVSAIHPPEQFHPRRISDSSWKPLLRSRSFLGFFLPITLFYISWQMDWSMWYIGQVQYLQLTQAQISIYNGIFNIGQLVAVLIVSRIVQRRGPDRVLPYAALAISTSPIIMILCAGMAPAMRMPMFFLLVPIFNAPQCIINLCVVQILLRVAPKGCRSMAASLYTLTITLSNCFVPYLGVQIYSAFGSDYRALVIFNWIVFCVRFPVFFMLLWRSFLVAKAKTQPE